MAEIASAPELGRVSGTLSGVVGRPHHRLRHGYHHKLQTVAARDAALNECPQELRGRTQDQQDRDRESPVFVRSGDLAGQIFKAVA